MKYKNAKDILPVNLMEEIQKHIQGEFVYIPIQGKSKVGWGQKNGARKMIYYRDEQIFNAYRNGYSIMCIAAEYNLSESSIRKIIAKMRKIDQLGIQDTVLGGQPNG